MIYGPEAAVRAAIMEVAKSMNEAQIEFLLRDIYGYIKTKAGIDDGEWLLVEERIKNAVAKIMELGD